MLPVAGCYFFGVNAVSVGLYPAIGILGGRWPVARTSCDRCQWNNFLGASAKESVKLPNGESNVLMADDTSERDYRDRDRINVHEDYEVQYWSKKFGVTPEQLRKVVGKVGNSVAAVERELKRAA